MSKPPILSVVGKSNVGKTTFLEKLIAELKRRGYRVATVKHDVHGFDIDHPGKDTWRHAAAGADTILIASHQKLAMIKKWEGERSLDELAGWLLEDVDIVFTEGFKRKDKPKIEVVRKARSEELICSADELLAIVSDVKFELDIPCFGLDAAAGLVDLIEKKYSLKPPVPG